MMGFEHRVGSRPSDQWPSRRMHWDLALSSRPGPVFIADLDCHLV